MKIKRKTIADLSDNELLRYNRHILLNEIDICGQKDLLNKHVAIVGLGGLGCPVGFYLAASGIGQLTIIDKDNIELTNLQRQILYTEKDLGKRKVDVASKKMSELNPNISIYAYHKEINELTKPSIFKNIDLVIDATDNFKTRTLLNKLTLKIKRPLIMGAAIKLSGQISVFRNDLEGEPCYNCLYNNYDDEIQTCSDQGVLSSLTGIIGSIQATEAIKVLLNIGKRLESRLLIIDAKLSDYRCLKLNKDPKCPSCMKQK